MADLPSKAPKSKAQPPTGKSQPHRFRVSVPAADEAVVAWMGLQDNPSLSVRMLIRESIERNGFVDVVNRPVAQLPKRGRPAGADGDLVLTGPGANEAAIATAAAFPPVPAVGTGAEAIRSAAQFPPMPAAVLDLDTPEAEAPELLGIALEAPSLKQDPRPAPAAAPALPEPEPAQGGQLEVGDIFSALR